MQSVMPSFCTGTMRPAPPLPAQEDGKKVPSRSVNPSPTNERERHLRALADKLLFTVEKSGAHFTLSRTADVSRPVRRERLSLKQAEELLATWKLRGLGGG